MNQNLQSSPLTSNLKNNNFFTMTFSKDSSTPFNGFYHHNNKSKNQNIEENRCNLAKQIIEVLRQENKNLKEQNAFLLGKLRIVSEKQQYKTEIQERHEGLIYELRRKNTELQNQVQYLNKFIKEQISKMNGKIVRIASQQNQISSVISIQPTAKQTSQITQKSWINYKLNSQTTTQHQNQDPNNEDFNTFQITSKKVFLNNKEQNRRNSSYIQNNKKVK